MLATTIFQNASSYNLPNCYQLCFFESVEMLASIILRIASPEEIKMFTLFVTADIKALKQNIVHIFVYCRRNRPEEITISTVFV